MVSHNAQTRAMADVVTKQFPGITITDALRPGANDHHGDGYAIDMAGGNMMSYFEFLIKAYPGSEEIIYTPGGARQIKNGKPHTYSAGVAAQHYSHVHWAASDLAKAATGGTPGAPTGGSTGGGMVDTILPGFSDFLSFVTNGSLWLRVGCYIAGALLIVFGVIGIAGKSVLGSGLKSITKTATRKVMK